MGILHLFLDAEIRHIVAIWAMTSPPHANNPIVRYEKWEHLIVQVQIMCPPCQQEYGRSWRIADLIAAYFVGSR